MAKEKVSQFAEFIVRKENKKREIKGAEKSKRLWGRKYQNT